MLTEILQKLTNQKSSIEDDIHNTFDDLQKTLNVRKSVLLMELEVNFGLKHKVRHEQITKYSNDLRVQISPRGTFLVFVKVVSHHGKNNKYCY